MTVSKEILTTNNLTTGYVLRQQQREISQLLSLQIKSGQFVALIGPNGSGKSTLLRTLSGLQPPLRGTACIDNIDIAKISRRDRAKLLSLVLTNKVNIGNLLVKDLVAVGRYPYTGTLGVLAENDHKVIKESLSSCGLKNYHNRLFSELSDGEQQRVMLARALAQDTPLMLLDEPTAHLDLPNRVALMKMLLELAQTTNKAILLSTHELDLALQWCDSIWLMNSDGTVKVGAPEDLVLSGAFSTVFENEAFYFDIPSGIFKMQRNTLAKIKLLGEESRYEWTKRALERKGYKVSDEGIATVVVANSIWSLTYKKTTTNYQSIAELLECIGEITKLA